VRVAALVLELVVLVSEIFGGAFTDHEHVGIVDLEGAVLARREHEAVRLAVHGLRAQSGGSEVDLLVLADLVERVVSWDLGPQDLELRKNGGEWE